MDGHAFACITCIVLVRNKCLPVDTSVFSFSMTR